MKGLIAADNSNILHERLKGWIKLVTVTGSAQVLIQAVGFISGVLVIRILPTAEYALYTLANTMLGTMTVLADGGISSGVMSQGGRVWQNKVKLGVVLSTGLELRRKFAVLSFIVSVPILLYLLLCHGAKPMFAVLVILSLVPTFLAALSDSLLEIVPKLHQAIRPLQRNQVSVGVGRLLFTLILFAFPWAFVAILATGIPRIYGNIKLRKISYRYAAKDVSPDPIIKKQILNIVKRTLPSAIYYTVSGQLTIWLLSVFGNTESVAQIGALGRFSLLLTIVSSIFSNLIVPRFARLRMSRSLILKRYMLINIAVILFLFLLVTVTYILRSELLWVLGPGYMNLRYEFVLSILTGCIGLLGSLSFSLLSCRGWVLNPFLNISAGVLGIFLGIYFFKVSTLLGAIYYNLFLTVYFLIIMVGYFIFKVFTVKDE